MTGEDLLVSTQGRLGLLTLNRPEALNALTHDMALAMEQALLAWREDGAIDAVAVTAMGERAFCAGGDIQALYHSGLKGPDAGRRFWRDEYRLNALIASYPKPYIALMNGITMGGGVGISAHGSHRIVTENTMLAMPETSIGFLPDVGGTYLLSRAPGESGAYLGLSGARMNAADAIYAGFADSYAPSASLPGLIAALGDGASPDEIISQIEDDAPAGELVKLQQKITGIFSSASVMESVERLTAMSQGGDDWAARTLKLIRRNAPLAVAAIFTALQRARGLETLNECLSLEYCFAHRALTGHDFLEGIRALVIDKDNKPDWRPSSLEEVTPQMVADVLAPLGEDEWKAA